jgi:hypothetical protein
MPSFTHTDALNVRPSKAIDHLNRLVAENSMPVRNLSCDKAGSRFTVMMENIKAHKSALNFNHVSLRNHQITKEIIANASATNRPGI